MNKSFWMPNGDVGYDNSLRIEPKRAHHWFMDAPEPDWFCTKKQALEAVNGRPMSGFSNVNVSLWENTPSFESGSGFFPGRLFESEAARTFGLGGQNLSSNMEIRAFEDQPNDSSISLSMGPTFNNADENRNFISMGPTFNRGDDNIISMGPAYNRDHDNFFPMGISYIRENENFITVGPAFEKRDDNAIPAGQTHENVASSVVPLGTTYEIGESTYNKAEGANMIISSYDLLINQSPEELGWKNSSQGNVDPNVSIAPAATSKNDKVRKIKEPKPPKKTSPNSFPSNVKSLLSTGILDGVPVKYVSWARDKSLRGLIKGSSYMCDCKDCKLSKAVNAYEFERHAGCKTKHPNNHIYFENGKTIYAVVQELKNTSQENLFEAMQTVTGSPINEKNFCIWRESYQAATRELQRIYGKSEVVMQSS